MKRMKKHIETKLKKFSDTNKRLEKFYPPVSRMGIPNPSHWMKSTEITNQKISKINF